jgi:hypothetical protein
MLETHNMEFLIYWLRKLRKVFSGKRINASKEIRANETIDIT